jgi:hypothetical protein
MVVQTDDDSYVQIDKVLDALKAAPFSFMHWGHYSEGDFTNRDVNHKQ